MTDSHANPYASPDAVGGLDRFADAGVESTPAGELQAELVRIRFWGRLVGVFSSIYGFLILVGLLVMLVVLDWRLPPPVVVVGVVNALLAFGMLLFGIALLRYGQAITRFLSRPTQVMFDKAIAGQRDTWRILGVVSVGVILVILWGLIV